MNVESFSVSVRSRFGLHSVSFLKRFFENHLSAGGFQETTCQQVVFLENHLSAGGFLENHLSAGCFEGSGPRGRELRI